MSKFNCTFSFFIGNYEPVKNSEDASPSKLEECKVSDFSEKDVEFFRSLSNGKIIVHKVKIRYVQSINHMNLTAF